MARAVGADEYVSPHVGGSPVGLVVIGRPCCRRGLMWARECEYPEASRGCTACSGSRSNCARSIGCPPHTRSGCSTNGSPGHPVPAGSVRALAGPIADEPTSPAGHLDAKVTRCTPDRARRVWL
jgi:hypothetical protein